MYKELVFYLEACESGSMFQTLPKDIGVFATTAANAKESSWGTYCSPHDKVDGKSIGSCLGDLYSGTAWVHLRAALTCPHRDDLPIATPTCLPAPSSPCNH